MGRRRLWDHLNSRENATNALLCITHCAAPAHSSSSTSSGTAGFCAEHAGVRVRGRTRTRPGQRRQGGVQWPGGGAGQHCAVRHGEPRRAVGLRCGIRPDLIAQHGVAVCGRGVGVGVGVQGGGAGRGCQAGGAFRGCWATSNSGARRGGSSSNDDNRAGCCATCSMHEHVHARCWHAGLRICSAFLVHAFVACPRPPTHLLAVVALAVPRTLTPASIRTGRYDRQKARAVRPSQLGIPCLALGEWPGDPPRLGYCRQSHMRRCAVLQGFMGATPHPFAPSPSPPAVGLTPDTSGKYGAAHLPSSSLQVPNVVQPRGHLDSACGSEDCGGDDCVDSVACVDWGLTGRPG